MIKSCYSTSISLTLPVPMFSFVVALCSALSKWASRALSVAVHSYSCCHLKVSRDSSST